MKTLFAVLTLSVLLTLGMAATSASTMGLKAGESSQADVVKVLGEPKMKSLSGNKETWIYEKQNETIMIEFDAFQFVQEVTTK